MGDPEKPPVTVHGGSTGHSTTSGYSVNYGAASGAVDKASTAVGELPAVATSITTAFSTAEEGLPSEFASAKARLKTLREGHVSTVNSVKTYGEGCVKAARGCLKEYVNASADQVAASARYQSKIDFENPGLFGQTEKGINDWADKKTKPLNDKLPKTEQTKVWGRSNEYENTGWVDPGNSTVKHETSKTGGGLTHTNTTTEYTRTTESYSQHGTKTEHTVSHGGASQKTIDNDFTSRTANSEVRVKTHTDVPPVGEPRVERSVTRRPIP